jgi:AmmeMemoRadiSam system protein A
MSPRFETQSVRPPTISEYTQEERNLLLQLAHRSIAAALAGRKLDLTPLNPHLGEMRGAFTTLHLDGRLRGCIGYVIPTHSLYRTVAETARAAAFDDPRFSPVTLEEAPQLKVEISVLSPLRPIRPDQVVTGVHGLIVTKSGRRGLLLPQVPVEWNWDRETFLSQTCLKAGLPPDAWMEDIDLQAFTAEVFSEESANRDATQGHASC